MQTNDKSPRDLGSNHGLMSELRRLCDFGPSVLKKAENEDLGRSFDIGSAMPRAPHPSF